MKLGKTEIGLNHPPYIIAEVSANHNQDLNRALKMVDAAKSAGVQCIKLQTWSKGSMSLDIEQPPFLITDAKSLWHGYTLQQLYDEAQLPWEWHKPIIEHARKLGLEVISTPFDAESVDFLETFNIPFYKIASFENVDLPLIAKVAKTKKPIIISCGLANIKEIDDAVTCARDNGASDVVLLKCTSQYPADPSNVNLKTLLNMRETFQCEVGFSDHTPGLGSAVASIMMGAVVIEKHFNLEQSDQSLDAAFSLGAKEMGLLATECLAAWQAKGRVHYGPTTVEQPSLQFRRSLYFVRDLKAGDVITAQDVRTIRPGTGLSPKHLKDILGWSVAKDVSRGTPLSWTIIGANCNLRGKEPLQTEKAEEALL